MDESDQQDTAHSTQPQTPADEREEHQSRRREGQRQRPNRGEVWIRRHATAIEAVAAVVIAAFTAALFTVGWWQWRALDRTNNLAAKNIKLSRQTLAMSHRAWLMVKGLEQTTISAGVQPRLKIWVQNFGSSPATSVWTRISLRTCDCMPDHRPPPAYGLAFISRAVGPGADGWVEAYRVGPEGAPFPAAIVDAINAHRRTAYVHVRLDYSDQFGTAGVTEFCAYYEPPETETAMGNFYGCPAEEVAR